MSIVSSPRRTFLMLQGPHGPFFDALGAMLRSAGHGVQRVGFNAGDRAFWRLPGFLPYTGAPEDWPETAKRLMERHAITDLVLYGDGRPVHAAAIRAAKARGITVHVFEEGYLRPYWITYERDGANGNSRLMSLSVAQMRVAIEASDRDAPLPPARWGDMRHHVLYGALYHGAILAANRRFRRMPSHRALPVAEEFRLNLRRLCLMPAHAVANRRATRRIRGSGHPYHLVLMQLPHDESFRAHAPFDGLAPFVETVVAGFAAGAPAHHHLVFKTHPLDDGREPVAATIRAAARAQGLGGRVHLVRGGPLAPLLDEARSAVTVNSTAGQQALWRGLPLRTFGRAIYAKPDFVSDQLLPDFFADPQRPDTQAYRDFRRFLLETSQVPGGFYSARGRQRALRHVVDMMLRAEDPYEALLFRTAARRQQSRALKSHIKLVS
jgi:capsular polysaccharide export protein